MASRTGLMTETIKVTWINRDGSETVADVPVGHSLMEAAVANGVDGVIGDCGGALACATCHVVVEHAPVPLADKKSTEAEMLDFAEVPAQPCSRLSCQIRAVPELDGIVLRVPTA
jgi:2Fe-2S ferredoxin